jgi:hypothetical protein
VHLHEDGGDADGKRSPGQHRHEFPLAAARSALTARLLHRVGGVEWVASNTTGQPVSAAMIGRLRMSETRVL